MDYEYFRVEESEQFSFFRIPKALFTEKEFEPLSTDAKLLYGILLDRLNLSRKNGWIDEKGHVFIIYTIAELKEILHLSPTTIIKQLQELDSVHGIGLIERFQQGCNRPAVIYVKNFIRRSGGGVTGYYNSGFQETGSPAFQNLDARSSKNWKSGIPKSRSPAFQNLDTSNTDINKTDRNYTEKNKESPILQKEQYNLYGHFRNVRLSDFEYRDLRERYPCEYQKLLDQLSIYMRSSGKMYQDHYATLLLWAGRNIVRDDENKYDCREGECL